MNAARRGLLAATLVAALPVPGRARAAGPDGVVLRVDGTVPRPLALTLADLRAMPMRQLDESQGVSEDGAPRAVRARRHGGVLLRDLLDRAGAPGLPRRDLRRSAVLATATDGYQVAYSWAELYLSSTGDMALVSIERDGLPLDAREGPVALVTLGDARFGPRHVRNLERLSLLRLGD